MKVVTILALLVATFGVFLSISQGEETAAGDGVDKFNPENDVTNTDSDEIM